MNQRKKRAIVTILALAVLLSATHAAYAAEQTESKAEEPSMQLNPSLRAKIKSIAVERTEKGVRLGAVIRLKNVANRTARVPDYELHAAAANGVSYRLEPSVTNSRSIQPLSEAEFSYLAEVNGVDSFDVTALRWVDVNYYVYPKEETVVLEIPVEEFAGEEAAWGETFSLAGLNSPLLYTPVAVNEQMTGQGIRTIIKLLVQNPGKQQEIIPQLTVEARDGKETYAGGRVEAGERVLEPGEEEFIHLAVAKKPNVKLERIGIGTMETFIGAKGEPVTYRVERAVLQLPSQARTVKASPYKLGNLIDLSRFSDVVPQDVQVALVELSMHEAQGAGFQTIVAKWKVENIGTKPLPVPIFGLELESKDGYRYVGMRQSQTAEQVLPGLATVVNYTFTVPAAETGEDVVLKLQQPVFDADGTEYRSDLAAIKLNAAQPGTDTVFSFYPFTVELKSKQFSAMFHVATGYSYKLKMDLVITQEEKVVADRDFSLMEIEIVDRLGRTLGSTELSFVSHLPNGNRRLITGETVAYFDNLRTEQFETDLTIKIYEKIDTPAGPVKRLVTSLK